MSKTLNAFKASNITPKGNVAAIFYTWAGGKADMAVGLPADKGASITGLQAFNLSAGSAYSIDYYGNPAGTIKAHLAMEDYFTANDLTMAGPAVEEYMVTGETEPDTNKWLTKIIYFAESKK
jgi:effector-binding domain-containing protein